MIGNHPTHSPTKADQRADRPLYDIRHLDPIQQQRLREIDQETRLQLAAMRRLADAAIRATK